MLRCDRIPVMLNLLTVVSATTATSLCFASGPTAQTGGSLTLRPTARPDTRVTMFGKRIGFCLIPFVLLSGVVFTLHAQTTQPTAAADRIQLRLNSEEAEGVLAILDKRAIRQAVAESDWQRLFGTEPYVRLKKREAAMHRDFTDEDFKKFVLSPELLAKRSALRETLDA